MLGKVKVKDFVDALSKKSTDSAMLERPRLSNSSAAGPKSNMPTLWILGFAQSSSVISLPSARTHDTSFVS
jgi:hypothetical protein